MKKRAFGQVTRGKTALNRLRQVDIYMLLAWSSVLTLPRPLIIDVGYGAQAWTALEMWERWRAVNGDIRLLGLEIDPERVANALPYALAGQIAFGLGGFNVLDHLGAERAQIIRAYNVLRQYDEAAVEEALVWMGQGLAVGGLLIEGTSTPSGDLVAFDVYQRTAENRLQHRELVLGTNFRQVNDPTRFQAILPKRLIHHMREAQPAAFFEAWRQALTYARAQGSLNRRRQWIRAAAMLSANYAVDQRRRIIGRGYVVLRDPLRPIPLTIPERLIRH